MRLIIWPRTHVLRDLRPYVCTYKNCKQTDQQYDSYKEWVAHETHFHEPLQPHLEQQAIDLSSNHTIAKLVVDSNESDFDPAHSHIKPETQDLNFGKRRQCPICTEKNVSMSHIGFHLQKLAIFALP